MSTKMLCIDNSIMNSNSVKEKAPRTPYVERSIKDSGEDNGKIEFLSRRDSRVRALENSINFLKTQQDTMLKGLHKEIETLRRTNKELQFRLVLCNCTTNVDRTAVRDCGCETRENELKNEVRSLNELLEDEKRKNSALLEQIKAMQLNQALANKRMKNESNLFRESRSARNTMGHNSIAVFDPVIELPANSRSSYIRRATQAYSVGLHPFLPALSNSNDPNTPVVERQNKTRNIHHKRLDRAHNLYPS